MSFPSFLYSYSFRNLLCLIHIFFRCHLPDRSIPCITDDSHKFCIFRTYQLINGKCRNRLVVSPQDLRIDHKIKIKFYHKAEHITDVHLIHPGKCLIQGDQPWGIPSCTCIFCNNGTYIAIAFSPPLNVKNTRSVSSRFFSPVFWHSSWNSNHLR